MSLLDSVRSSDEGSDEGSGEGSEGGGTTVSPVCFRLVFLGLGSFTPFFCLSACLLHAMRIHVSGESSHQNQPAMGSQCSCRRIQIDPTLDTIPWFSSIRVLGKSSTEFERSDAIRGNRTRSGRSFEY